MGLNKKEGNHLIVLEWGSFLLVLKSIMKVWLLI